MHADAKLLFMKTDCPSLERIDGDRRLVKLVLHDKNSGDSVDQTSPVWFLGIHPTGAQEIDHPWMLPPVGSREGCKNMVRFANQKPSHRTTQPLLPRPAANGQRMARDRGNHPARLAERTMAQSVIM